VDFQVTGLSPEPFQYLYGLSDEELALRGVKRYIADKKPGFPDRIEMRDADVVNGNDVERVIMRFFGSPDIAYIHAHNAKRGCYSGRIDRV
jgi:hypothetical protein